jgi:Protein of unknown function (DUF2442).
MMKIVRAAALDNHMLDIEFSSGSLVLLDLSAKMAEPDFFALETDGRLYHPKTDGSCIYWPNGPSISIAEIINILQGSDLRPAPKGE